MEHQKPDIALAINQISGLDVNVGILLVGGICIFYTSIGGMKAVIWTDVWQIMWMVAGFVAILAVTCIDFGGFMEVVNLNIVSSETFFRPFHFNVFITLVKYTFVIILFIISES